jgi:hypothetical protein
VKKEKRKEDWSGKKWDEKTEKNESIRGHKLQNWQGMREEKKGEQKWGADRDVNIYIYIYIYI